MIISNGLFFYELAFASVNGPNSDCDIRFLWDK